MTVHGGVLGGDWRQPSGIPGNGAVPGFLVRDRGAEVRPAWAGPQATTHARGVRRAVRGEYDVSVGESAMPFPRVTGLSHVPEAASDVAPVALPPGALSFTGLTSLPWPGTPPIHPDQVMGLAWLARLWAYLSKINNKFRAHSVLVRQSQTSNPEALEAQLDAKLELLFRAYDEFIDLFMLVGLRSPVAGAVPPLVSETDMDWVFGEYIACRIPGLIELGEAILQKIPPERRRALSEEEGRAQLNSLLAAAKAVADVERNAPAELRLRLRPPDVDTDYR